MVPRNRGVVSFLFCFFFKTTGEIRMYVDSTMDLNVLNQVTIISVFRFLETVA